MGASVMAAFFQRFLNVLTITTVVFAIGALTFVSHSFYKDHQECNAPKTSVTVTAEDCKRFSLVECLELMGHVRDRDPKCDDDHLFSYKRSARDDLGTIFFLMFIPLLGVMTANYLFFGRVTIWNSDRTVGERQSSPSKNSSDTN